MDLDYFFSYFLSFVDYVKKRIKLIVVFFSFIILVLLGFYLKYSFELDSSNSFSAYISGESDSFLQNRQFGFYENIRQILLEKSDKEKKEIKILSEKHDLFKRYLKFISQLDGKFGDEFDSILEAQSSPWRNLLITSKVFYDKSYQDGKNIPFFLNVLIQYKGDQK